MLATPDLIAEAAQPGRLAELLPGWLREVPLYRSAAASSWPRDPLESIEELRRLSFISKRDIRRDFPRNFLGDPESLDDLLEREVVELEHTAGTSEERIPLLLPRHWWAQQERRALELNPLAAEVLSASTDARRVTINSPMCSNDICFTGIPSRSERIVGQSLFVSLSRYPFLWSRGDLERMAAETVQWQPQFLDVDPVYGAVFALYCERHNIRLPSLRFVLGSYEFISHTHRRILERVFGVPVFDLYGSTETGHLLMEDERQELRPSLETAYFEVIETDPQDIGELAVTTLTNPFMPLIRYRIGDLVERIERPVGARFRLHGRAADAFRTCDGRRVTTRQVDQCFADVAGIVHYQVIEPDHGPWRLRFVPDGPGPAPAALRELRERLQHLLATDKEWTMQPTDMLVPERSGKFRLGYPAG